MSQRGCTTLPGAAEQMEERFKTKTQTADTPENQILQVEVASSFEQLEPIQCEWDAFVESVGSEIFLTYDWCRIWWKYYGRGRKLYILLFRSDAELVGIIPLFFENIWLGPICLRTAKIVSSDFTISHFSIPINNCYLNAVVEGFCKVLSQQKWDVLCLGQLAGLYTNYEYFCEAIEKVGGSSYIVTAKQTNVQTYFEVKDSWKAQLSTLSKRNRGEVRRTYKYVCKAIGDENSEVKSSFIRAENLENEFCSFVEMHQSSWNKKGKMGHFGDWPESRGFHLEMAKAQCQKNRLKLLKVMLKKYCLGYEYNYSFGRKYLEFLNARSDLAELKKASLGKITFGELLKKTIDENITYIDSMQCKYDHKLRLGGKLFPMMTIYVLRKSLLVVIRLFIFRFLSRLLDMCYFKIWYCRIAPKLPFKSRPLWRIWIRTNAFAG